MRRFVGSFILLLLAMKGAARAQVTGAVTDRQGAAVAGAAVELWAGDSRTAVLVTDATGRFAFSVPEARGASGLLVRHPGLRTARLQLAGGAAEVAVRLSPEPLALEGVTGRAARRRPCPNREAPEARALWAAAAARYSDALDSLGVGSLYLWNERTVDSEREVGPVGASSLQRGGVGSHAGWRTRWPVSRLGYAGRLTGSVPYPEFGAWYYPLESLPAHLSSVAFGELHTFSIEARETGEVEIGFCPRPGTLADKPRLQGLLTVSTRDTLFLDARYEFRTPDPDEHAGVEIVYAPAVAADGRPLPVPATELYWRRPAGSRRYYQKYTEYVGWQLGPTDHLYVPPFAGFLSPEAQSANPQP